MQVRIEENIYFQQEDEKDHHYVVGTYVNAHFIKVEVDHELTEDELYESGKELYETCKKSQFVNNMILYYKEKYSKNPNWDLGWE